MNTDGKLVTGPQTIDGLTYYFDSDGRQVKGERRKVNGKSYFYDPDNGALVTNRLVTFKAGRFIPEENYAKEVRFDEAVYSNFSIMNILNSNGIILVPMAYQSQDGKPSMVISTISKMMEIWSYTDFSTTITSTVMVPLLEIYD